MSLSGLARGTDPLVSVIIPAYNGASFLARTLASISRQTYRNIEIIVHDDGSTDATPAIVAAAARRDDRIRYYSGPNGGVNAARNAAVARAHGDAIAPCDQDDLWHPEKLERQVGALYGRSPEAGVAYCWTDGVDEHDAVIFPGWSRPTAEGDVWRDMVSESLPGCGSNVLIRREVFEAAGGYPTDGEHADDWHLYIALASLCRWVVVPVPLVGYRLASHNVSRDYEMSDRLTRADTDWILATWPDLPAGILRRRTYGINRYLAFQAVRRRHFLQAMRFRARAIAARPGTLLTIVTLLEFPALCILELVGVRRYYWPPWRSPATWPGALGLPPSDSPRITVGRIQ